jgi:hypothetical protein
MVDSADRFAASPALAFVPARAELFPAMPGPPSRSVRRQRAFRPAYRRRRAGRKQKAADFHPARLHGPHRCSCLLIKGSSTAEQPRKGRRNGTPSANLRRGGREANDPRRVKRLVDGTPHAYRSPVSTINAATAGVPGGTVKSSYSGITLRILVPTGSRALPVPGSSIKMA